MTTILCHPRHPRHRLDRRSPTGGMGEVWGTTGTVLDREVAVQLLDSEYADDPGRGKADNPGKSGKGGHDGPDHAGKPGKGSGGGKPGKGGKGGEG